VNTTGQQAEQADAKPTIVLVHGAFADASSWNGVIEVEGSHVIMISQPQAVTDHIVKAAQAVVSSGR
jgi:hypothetical protein